MLTTEALLMLLVLGLYLYDSALLLYSNEALLVARGKQRWSAGFGSRHTTLRGRHVYIPNPLLPARALFRLSWQTGAAQAARPDLWAAQRAALACLTVPVCGLAVVVFLLLPLALFGGLGDLPLALAFLLIYLGVLAIVLVLWFKRRQLALTTGRFALLALDLLICPPFALNIMRRLALRQSSREDFVAAARRLLAPADWDAARLELLARLEDELAIEAEDSPRTAALHALRAELG